MNDISQRMTGKDKNPDAKGLLAWLGATNYKRWNRLVEFIDVTYPGVFTPEWLFGGMKYGWSLRFKKSKSFCTLIPERNRVVVLIVFGKEERGRAESIIAELDPAVREAYTQAKTYHDGKWVWIPFERDLRLRDIQKLLAIKRRPPQPKTGKRGAET